MTRSDCGTHPPSGPASSASRRAPAGHLGSEPLLPPSWLDRLLDACHHAATSHDPVVVCEAFVEAIAAALPDCAVGVCIDASLNGAGPLVLRKLPGATLAREAGRSRRILSDWGDEQVFPIPHEEGCSLHCASVAPLPESGIEIAFLEQAAKIFALSIRELRAEIAAARHSEDLTRLKAQVLQSEKLAGLGQIAAGIVHELNNPLTSIIAYSDYLQKKAVRDHGDPTDIERLRRINEAAERIRTFARDLVAYARPSNDAALPVSIDSVVDRALVFCEHVLSQAEIEVERRFVPGAIQVFGSSGQLTQVFVNLITNACHAMAESGGRLSVTIERGDRDIAMVSIADTGIGIAEAHLPQLFDPFFTTKADGRGTGLGLAIVHDIVMAHGGKISAKSELGRGTVFTLELPTFAHAEPKSE